MDTTAVTEQITPSTACWDHPRVQEVAWCAMRKWGVKLHRNGMERDDLWQEMAAMFIKAKATSEPDASQGKFLGYFKTLCANRLIDIHRRHMRRGREVITTEFFYDLKAGEDDYLELALQEAPPVVQSFVREFQRLGLKPKDEDGNFQPIDQFSRRVTGRRWGAVRSMIEDWARTSLSRRMIHDDDSKQTRGSMAPKTELSKADKIEAELMKLTKLKRKDDESQEDWVKRLAKKALAADQSVIDGMDEATYDHCNAVADAIEAKGPIPDFDGSDTGEAVEDAEDAEDAEEPSPDEGEAPEAEQSEDEEAAAEEAGEDAPEDDAPAEDDEPAPAPKAKGKSKDKEPPAKLKVGDTVPEVRARPHSHEQVKSKVTGAEMSRHDSFRQWALCHMDILLNDPKGRAKLLELGEKSGINLPRNSMSTVLYHTKGVLEDLREMCGLKFPLTIKNGKVPKTAAVKPAPAAKAPPAKPAPAAKPAAKAKPAPAAPAKRSRRD